MSASSPPVLADRYELGRLLGRGGAADVHAATDRVLGREVAVKLLRDPEPHRADRERFVREARTLAGLAHPNLVTVLDAGSSDDRPFLVMELVPGGTLADELRAGALDQARVAQVGAQVADALAYVHAAGVVHRDVKPGNVLLRPDGRAWLNDFGVARLVADATSHTRGGLTVGSPAYLSPEQAAGEPVSTASDLYSLGLVLLESLSGRRAFPGTVAETSVARLYRDPDVPAGLPGAWRSLLTGLVDRDPLRRPDAGEVADRLRSLAGGLPHVQPAGVPLPRAVGAGPAHAALPGDGLATGDVPTVAASGASPRRRAVVVAAAVVTLVAAAGGAAVLLPGDRPRTAPTMPDGVEAPLHEPLEQLHEAVHEAGP